MSRVLQVGPLPTSLGEALRQEIGALVLPDDGGQDEFLAGPGRRVEIAVTAAETGVSRELMEALPSLRAVANLGAGYDTTDVGAAVERGVVVSNTPDVLTDCVADTAVGLTLDVMRGLSAADRFVRRGAWADGDFPLMRKVTGARVGILGLGRIGRAIATRFEAFGCPISYYGRREQADSPYWYAGSLTELAASVDVLVVAAAGGRNTRHLVDRAVLEALGPHGFLINVARGSVVDEQALVELLVDGGIAGAGLDVFADEPRAPPALWALDNVVIVPHLGSGTIETRAAMADLVLENVRSYLAGGRLITPVPGMQGVAGPMRVPSKPSRGDS